MDQATVVRFAERVAYLAQHLDDARRRDRAEPAHQRLQVEPVEQLHDKVEGPGSGLAEVVQPDRVRRLQA